MPKAICAAVLLTVCLLPSASADWPAWRADAARSGRTPDDLPDRMSRQWSWHPLLPPQPAWPRDPRMTFDQAPRLVAARGKVYFGSSTDDTVRALDSRSGELAWSYCTDGPIRFAPVVWKDRLFVVSDDGWLYCLNADDGTPVNRWRGGPSDARVLGNSRIVSKWPARGGPVIAGGVLYWAAGIWQSEGIFIHAMDPDTGDTLWINCDSGGIDMPQPHGGAQAKSGVSAQGHLLADAARLFVPTGRAVPAAFTRENGRFEYYRLQENGHRGGTAAMLAGDLLYNGGAAFQTGDGAILPGNLEGAVAALPPGIVHGVENRLRALQVVMKEGVDRKGGKVMVPSHDKLWQVDDVPSGTALITAADTIITAGGHRIAGVDARSRRVLWTEEVDAAACELAAADGRIYASTTAGTVYCFGPEFQARHDARRTVIEDGPWGPNEDWKRAAAEIVKAGVTEGYCVDLGCRDGALAYELARQTQLHIVAIDPDPENVAIARMKLAAAGLYGARVTVHQGDPAHTQYPKFFANLVVSSRSVTDGPGAVDAPESQRLQRPCGGIACFGPPRAMQVTTRGPLEDAGEWTHLYGGAANTLCSTDAIRGPLSVLWFRDVNLELPQRHGRGPSPLFRDGRLFVEGLNGVTAVDAYNGRPLWHFAQPGLLAAYNADHLAGTAISGSNMCLAGESLFLRHEDRCRRIDAATGNVVATFAAPRRAAPKPPTWGYLACEDGVLFGSIANEDHIVQHAYQRADAQMKQQFSESRALFAFDVDTGRLLWRYDAQESIRHNAIAVGNGRVFLIDRARAAGDLLFGAPVRRGEKRPPGPEHSAGVLVTLDAKTGERVWDSREDIFGTTLSYSGAHDVLLMSYLPTRFKLPSETGGRMAAFHAADGYRLWERKVTYSTRPLINDRTIIAWPSSLDLLTGDALPFMMAKSYGCGQLAGSQHLLTFRSGTFGYFDFTRQAGTENFGGIRPGCWINALPVGGLVLVPDASAGCRCSYQNRAWVALQGSE
jgi:outer membrane protein assembly factor BamB